MTAVDLYVTMSHIARDVSPDAVTCKAHLAYHDEFGAPKINPGPISNILILLSLLNALFLQSLGQIVLLKQFQQKIIDMKTSLTDIQASQCQIVQ